MVLLQGRFMGMHFYEAAVHGYDFSLFPALSQTHSLIDDSKMTLKNN